MKTGGKKSINYYMRLLHRYIGYFIIGFVIIYAFSGIVLIYRDTDFMKHEKTVRKNLPVTTSQSDLGQALKIRDLNILETKDNMIYFQGGSFNKTTGEVEYKVKDLVFPFNKFTSLHKSPSKNPLHLVTVTFSILLLFMAVSSFWMLSVKSESFRTGICLTLAGIVFSFLLLVFI